MSGTSLDGVDAALVQVEGEDRVDLVAFRQEPFTSEQRHAILQTIAAGTARDLALLNVTLGRAFAGAAERLLGHADIPTKDVAYIATHGQTVWHEPRRATLQLGDPAVIAEQVGVQVVSDFRSRDVAAGGHGAPLVPMADAMLFASPEHGRVLLNLGGMANFTWVPRRGSLDGVVAGDTGPGVAIIDAVSRVVDPGARFDEGGERAQRGEPERAVVEQLLLHPFFQSPPPKSTGRELFSEVYAQKMMALVKQHRPAATGDDCVATAVLLTTLSVCRHLRRWVPKADEIDLIVSGGGARNPVLLEGLRARCELPIARFDEVFFDGDAKEAVAFAYLGWLTLRGRAGNVPCATGATGPRVLGRITPA